MRTFLIAAAIASVVPFFSAHAMQLNGGKPPVAPMAKYTPWSDEESQDCGACTPMEEGWEFFELVPWQEVTDDVPSDEVEFHAVGYDPEIATDADMSSADAEGYCLELSRWCGPTWADQRKDSVELEMLWVEFTLRATEKKAELESQAANLNTPN